MKRTCKDCRHKTETGRDFWFTCDLNHEQHYLDDQACLDGTLAIIREQVEKLRVECTTGVAICRENIIGNAKFEAYQEVLDLIKGEGT